MEDKKLITYLIIILGLMMGVLSITLLLIDKITENHQIIDLPEEHKSITKYDTLNAYFDKDKVLHLEFKTLKNK